MPRSTANPTLAEAVSKKAAQPAHMKHYQNEQRAIIRQSCLKCAVSLVEPLIGKITVKNEKGEKVPAELPYYQALVLEQAEMFEAWVNRPYETEAGKD